MANMDFTDKKKKHSRRKQLKSFAKSKTSKDIIMVRKFTDLTKVSIKLTKILCKHSKKKAVHPACRALECLLGFKMIVTKKGKCRCVPIRRKKVLKYRPCRKICDDPHKRLTKDCRCICRRKCPPRFTLNHKNCKCRCHGHCKVSFKMDKGSCTCRKLACPAGKKLVLDRCIPRAKVCARGYTMAHGICYKGRRCPPRYKRLISRLCVRRRYHHALNSKLIHEMKKRCIRGVFRGHVCHHECKKGFYYFRGSCHSVAAKKRECELQHNMYFDARASLCQGTCKYPVPYKPCKKKLVPKCVCYPGFFLHKGKCIHASECPNKPMCLKRADIAFLLDATLSMGKKNFYLMKQFTRDVIELLDLQPDKHRVAFASFDERLHNVKKFDNFLMTKRQLLTFVNNAEFTGGVTLFGRALKYYREHIFTTSAGMRHEVPRVMIILTDGSEDMGTTDQYYEARKLRELGIQLIIMAVSKESLPAGKSVKSIEFLRVERLNRLAGLHGAYQILGLKKYREILPLLNRMVSFKECGKPVCPLPRTYEGPCIHQYRDISKVFFVRKGKSYRCVEKTIKKYNRIRCACPKDQTILTTCHKQFRKIITVLYKISRENVCYKHDHAVKWRCECPGPKIKKGPCIGQFREDQIKTFIPHKMGPGHISCPHKIKTKRVRCGCAGPTEKIEKCMHNFKIIRRTSWRFKKEKCIKKVSVHEKRCACPGPTFKAEDCRKKSITVHGYFQFVRKDSNGCRTDDWIKTFSCDRKCSETLDLAIIIDSSDSVRKPNFLRMKQFVKALISQYDIGRKKTRVALMIYSSRKSIRLIFPFISYLKKDTMLKRIDSMVYRPGSTSTGAALRDFRVRVATYTHGLRKDSRKVVVLMTDGAANDKDPEIEAKKLRALNFRIITIGIGDSVSKKMLKQFASEPYQDNVFISKFENIKTLLTEHNATFAHLHCSLGEMNKFAVMDHLKQKVLDMTEGKTAVTESMLQALKFIRLPTHNMFKVSIYLVGDLDKILGMSSPITRKRLEDSLKDALGKKMKLKKYNIHGFHLPSTSSSKCISLVKKLIKKRPKRAAVKKEDKTATKGKADKKKTAAKKSSAKKAGAKKGTAKKAGAKKAGAKKAGAKKAGPKKAGAKKAGAKKAGAEKKKGATAKGKGAGGAQKCFEIRFLFAKAKVKTLMAISEFKVGANTFKVYRIVFTTPGVRHVQRECVFVYNIMVKLIKWYKKHKFRPTGKKEPKLSKLFKQTKRLKENIRKSEILAKTGKNKKALAAMKETAVIILEILIGMKDSITKMSSSDKKKLPLIMKFQDSFQKKLERHKVIPRCQRLVKSLLTALKPKSTDDKTSKKHTKGAAKAKGVKGKKKSTSKAATTGTKKKAGKGKATKGKGKTGKKTAAKGEGAKGKAKVKAKKGAKGKGGKGKGKEAKAKGKKAK